LKVVETYFMSAVGTLYRYDLQVIATATVNVTKLKQIIHV